MAEVRFWTYGLGEVGHNPCCDNSHYATRCDTILYHVISCHVLYGCRSTYTVTKLPFQSQTDCGVILQIDEL